MQRQYYIEPDELAEIIDQADVRVVDARSSLADGPTGRQMWSAGHIPGAVHADWIDDWGTTVDGVEGMLPGPDDFAEAMSRLGIGNDTWVIAYDDNGLFTASRLAWALLEYGHERVSVLDGGFPAWQRSGGAVSDAPATEVRGDFRPGAPQGTRTDMRSVRAGLGDEEIVLVDCRMEETFQASAGRIPGAGRLPAPGLVGPDGRFRDADEVARMASEAGIVPGRRTVLYCGGGVSAAAVHLALREAGFEDTALYDGSWSEWSQHADNPIEEHR